MVNRRVDVDIENPGAALAALAGLLAADVDPQAVVWRELGSIQAGLFDGAPGPDETDRRDGDRPDGDRPDGDRPDGVRPDGPPASPAAGGPGGPPWPRELPAGFVALASRVAMHRDPDRFTRLHQMARRLVADPRIGFDELDPALLQLRQMAREVRLEIHRMHAFVRFRPIPQPSGLRHIAWFEPHHAVVRAAAPFFVERFAAMAWSILTPRLSVEWDRRQLRYGPGADPDQAPAADAGEALWIAYYRSIFNPARLNPAAMRREMPRRYWSNLPEAAAIAGLIRDAPARNARMQAHVEGIVRRLPAKAPQAAALPPVAPEARLIDLARRARYCSDCPLAAHATQVVWGEGAVGARLMLVGEQPGDHEDLAGRAFVGPAGQLLRQAIARLGWPVSALYLTNAVKHFRFALRGNRRIHKTPGQREMLACAQWLEAEIRLVRPTAIVALGATAASSLLGRPVRVGERTGQPWLRADGIAVRVVHHPAAVLRRAESGAPSFDDWVEELGRSWPAAGSDAIAGAPR